MTIELQTSYFNGKFRPIEKIQDSSFFQWEAENTDGGKDVYTLFVLDPNTVMYIKNDKAKFFKGVDINETDFFATRKKRPFEMRLGISQRLLWHKNVDEYLAEVDELKMYPWKQESRLSLEQKTQLHNIVFSKIRNNPQK